MGPGHTILNPTYGECSLTQHLPRTSWLLGKEEGVGRGDRDENDQQQVLGNGTDSQMSKKKIACYLSVGPTKTFVIVNNWMTCIKILYL